MNAFINSLWINKDLIKEGIKYLVVGGLCTLFDFTILYIGVEYLELNYLIVSVFSFICGVILNYALCTYWVFKIRVINKTLFEFFVYCLISLVGLIINTMIIWLGTEYIGFYFMISKLLSAIITYFWNFLGRKYLLHYNRKL